VFVSGAGAADPENVFSGNWTTNTGSVSFRVVSAAEGSAALVADGGRACSSPTVYYRGTYSDPGPRTGEVVGCTVGGPTHLVGRYVGDASTDKGSAGNIDIVFISPSSFNGTYTQVSTESQQLPYVGSFASHFAGDGCCPGGTTTTGTGTTSTPATTETTPPPGGPAQVFNLSVDSVFPVTGAEFSDVVASFESTAGGGTFTASIAWGDGTPPSPGTVSPPTRDARGFGRAVSGTHTYARSGVYLVRVTVTDPRGASVSATNQATVTACFCSTRPPVLGRTADIGPVSGLVLVKLPPGARASSAHAAAVKGTGFVPLTVPREIPVGSVIDARRGKLVVMAATATAGVLGGGAFSGGIFQLVQNRRERGVTELGLRSGTATVCRATGKARTAAAKKLSSRILGLLHASVKGQFRTRGRYSSGTVRGTEWTTTDRCDGTLTQVTRGAVTVFDLRRRRNIVVSAGHSYLAAAR
jgi:hypothetical protein